MEEDDLPGAVLLFEHSRFEPLGWGGGGRVGKLDRAVVHVGDPGVVAVDRDLGPGDVPDELHALILIGFDDLHQVIDAAELLASVEGVEGWRGDAVKLCHVIDGGAGVEGAQGVGDRSFVGIVGLAALGAEV